METRPLCPELHRRIEKHLGPVTIASPGMAFRGKYVNQMGRDGKMRPKLVVDEPGEYYRVNCPRCGDARKRLYINHRFAQYTDLAICYNEHCYHDHFAREGLLMLLFRSRPKDPPAVRPGKIESAVLKRGEWPGTCIPLKDLSMPHEANDYLQRRGYDVPDLVQRFDLRYCVDAVSPLTVAKGRIIIPVIMNGAMVGWQARFVGDRNWKACPFPKYWDLPGMAKRAMLYNHDSAARQPWAVIQEGVADVWSTGAPALGLLCKSLSFHQKQILTNGLFRDKPLLVMLDGEAREDTDDIVAELRRESLVPRPVIPVYLPEGTDPGDYTPEENLNHIYRTAENEGVYLERIVPSGVQYSAVG